MIEAAVMIEGQDGLTWPRWKRIARTVEEAGFAGLYRSDHYTNPQPPDKPSLELWTSLTWLAAETERIEFGPLVSPVSFRHPSMTARMAAAVDDLSGGRLILGVGAGWMEREHEVFGRDLLGISERFDRFEEGLEIISRLLENDQPSRFEGQYFQLRDGILLPRPNRPGGPPLLIGGNGPQRTLPLTARFADEWNAVFIPLETYRKRAARLDDLLKEEGREFGEVRRSLMTRVIYDRNPDQIASQVEKEFQGEKTPDDLRKDGYLVGTGDQIIDQLKEWESAGVQRVMMQWLDQRNLFKLRALADDILDKI
ncbi:MAG: TIGR03560 family F420-dependent LLM class oxidoreductase [Anaerolineales bacterium]|nr:TIGR03560 family F420-dependent LLM class oxidoreductase [Anaerolineales bacterium]